MRAVTFLLWCGVVLGGCAGVRQAPKVASTPVADAVPVTVFHDGFHAGFLLPNPHPDLAWLDETVDDLARTSPLVELGFAADNWVAVREPGSGTTCATAMWGGPGVLMGSYIPDGIRPARDPGVPVRFWTFHLGPAAWAALMAHCRAWADVSIRRVRQPGVNQLLVFSPRRWMLHRNCNDFVIDGLRAAGLDSCWRLGYTADGTQDQLEVLHGAVPAGAVVSGP